MLEFFTFDQLRAKSCSKKVEVRVLRGYCHAYQHRLNPNARIKPCRIGNHISACLLLLVLPLCDKVCEVIPSESLMLLVAERLETRLGMISAAAAIPALQFSNDSPTQS